MLVVYHELFFYQGSAEDEADARKSFPSGHASVVCFVAAFVAVYLQRRSSAAVSTVFLLRPIIQVRRSDHNRFIEAAKTSPRSQ